jgi:hypothetical protein
MAPALKMAVFCGRSYLMSEFLDEVESDSYKDLVRDDLTRMEAYLKGSLTDEQRAEIHKSQNMIRPLLDLDRLTFDDCHTIDAVFDRMAQLGLPLSDDY